MHSLFKSFDTANIQAAFRIIVIYPNDKAIDPNKLYPNEGVRDKEPLKKVVAIKSRKEAVEKILQQKFEKIESEMDNIRPNTKYGRECK